MKLGILQCKVGEKVHYKPEHYKEDEFENGIIKEVRPTVPNIGIWVVYKCAGNWKDYQDYSAGKTNLRDLHLGWLSTKFTCDVCKEEVDKLYMGRKENCCERCCSFEEPGERGDTLE